MVRVRATKEFESLIDGAIGRPRKEGEEWEVDQARADHLVAHGVAVIVPQKIAEVADKIMEEDIVLEKPKRGRKKKS